jgi:drug/metabolite transporter (DMT)-like permease
MRQVSKSEKKGVSLILISALGYGLMPIFSVSALKSGVNVYTLLFTRFLLAALLLWTYIFIKKIPYKTSFRTTLYILFISLIGFTVASVSIYKAYELISSALATILLFTHPLFVVFIESILKKHKLQKHKLISSLIILVGLVIVLYEKNIDYNIKGVLLGLTSSVAYAIFCYGLHDKETQKLSGITITAYMASVTAITALVQCLINGVTVIPNDTALIAGILLAIFSTVMASVTFYEGLSIIGPSSATLISSFEPLFVMVMGIAFLDETFSIKILIGGIVIILGIIYLEKKRQ